MALMRACPVCGQHSGRVLFRPKFSPGPVAKCQRCGMVYVVTIEDDHALFFDGPFVYYPLQPKVLTSSNLEDVKDSWEFRLLPDKEIEWPALRQNAVDALQRIERHMNKAPTECRILDFGSGWGFFLTVAKEQGWITYGLEPLPASSVYARAMFGLNIITDTLRQSTFPSDFFDVITSFQVFEHLPNPTDVFQHFHKSLRQDGIVLIEVPNFETWTMRILRSHHRHFVQDHLNFFSIKTLTELLMKSRFKVIDQYYPTRRMSFRHLSQDWFGRYLHPFIADALQNSLKRTSLWDRTIGLNIGDIIAVIAQKLE